MKNKADLSDFKHSVVVDARRAGLSFQKVLNYWGFPNWPSEGFTKNRPKRKISSEVQFSGKICLYTVKESLANKSKAYRG